MRPLHEPSPRRRGVRVARGDGPAPVDHGARRGRVAVDLRRVRPVPRTGLVPGTVVWARIPYSERPADSKARPAIVLAVRGRDVDLLPITSSSKESVRRSDLYVALEAWAAAGLNRPCLVCRKPVTVDIIDVTTLAGELAEPDRTRVLEA